jgi:hypothetical protein
MKKCAMSLCAILVFCGMLFAQTPQVVSEVHITMPKPGMQAQFEEGRKKHSAFHAAQKDTWKIYVWEIVSGERTGAYMQATPGHNWKDFDDRAAFNKLDGPDVAKNMEPFSGPTLTAYYVYREDLSLTKVPATLAKMRTTVSYSVYPEHVNDFIESIKKINAGLQKTNYPVKPSRWYSLANGGDTPTFVLVTDRATWGDMEPPEKKLEDALKEAYGDSSALDTLRKSCRKITSELSVYREVLSYITK